MADETPRDVVRRAADLEDQRIDRARELALAEERRRQNVKDQLDDHARQLKALTTTVGQVVDNYARLQRGQDEQSDKLDAILQSQRTKDAVSLALQTAVEQSSKAVDKAAEKQISTRAFYVGVAAIIATILIAVVSQAHLFG